jgi:hypothetical protein
MQLNPYNTVCGLLYFGFLSEVMLQEIKRQHPFEHWGYDTWKTNGPRLNRSEGPKNGFSESPATPKDLRRR